MHDTAKYLIHADITADGVVERSDVVGAIFGQTEGLLGDELDLRDLQDSSKVGRIDVDVDSQNGQSYGSVTIATSLDKVETAILAAALETIDRVGPCRAAIDVDAIEDVRAAKRREVVERAKSLLAESFDGSMLSSADLIREVRDAVRVEDITEYEGYPAGPRVAGSDAIIVVEGRADVLQLLKYGVKNAIAVEGTNVPDQVADLTEGRTVTAFLDGDRGGDLILKELSQVGDVDYVAFAPPDRSVEDLERHEVMAALRDKVSYDAVAEGEAEPGAVAATDGSTAPAPDPSAADASTGGPESPPEPGLDPATAAEPADAGGDAAAGQRLPEPEREAGAPTDAAVDAGGTSGERPADDGGGPDPGATPHDEGAAPEGGTQAPDDDGTAPAGDAASADDRDGRPGDDEAPSTLRGHVEAVVEASTGTVRLLTAEQAVAAEGDAADAFELVRDAESVPAAVVLDGRLDQRLLDVAAQRGVDQVVAASIGDLVKRPTSVRIRTADQLQVAE